ncbi:hypothetical protein Tco_0237064 [Tanacetum coccineum]
MSKSTERAQTPANSVVRNTASKGSKQATEEKVHQEELQAVQTRLTYGESSRQKAQTKEKTQLSESESCDKKKKNQEKAKSKPGHHVQKHSSWSKPERLFQTKARGIKFHPQRKPC